MQPGQKNKVYQIIANHAGKKADEIKDDDGLQENLGLDSIDNVQLVDEICDEFNIDINPEKDLQDVHSVADLIKVVEKKLAHKK
jgi:acyl carrier protein